MERKIKLSISGKDVVLNFGINWMYEHFFNDTGIDIIKDSDKLDEMSTGIGFYKILIAYIWAGHLAECSLNNTDPVITRDEVTRYIMSGDENHVREIAELIIMARSGGSEQEKKMNGQKKKDTVGQT